MVIQEASTSQFLLTQGIFLGRFYPKYSVLIDLGFDFGVQTVHDPMAQCLTCSDHTVFETFRRNDGYSVIARCSACGARNSDVSEGFSW